MPIYEYACPKCEAITEVLQRASDPPPNCTQCGADGLQRVMSRTSFILKGEGWYITDYARKGQSKNGKDGKTSEPSSAENKTEKKQDTPAKATKKPPKGDKAAS